MSLVAFGNLLLLVACVLSPIPTTNKNETQKTVGSFAYFRDSRVGRIEHCSGCGRNEPVK